MSIIRKISEALFSAKKKAGSNPEAGEPERQEKERKEDNSRQAARAAAEARKREDDAEAERERQQILLTRQAEVEAKRKAEAEQKEKERKEAEVQRQAARAAAEKAENAALDDAGEQLGRVSAAVEEGKKSGNFDNAMVVSGRVLVEMYRLAPQGMSSDGAVAAPVREIGRILDAAGGMNLMLGAHDEFRKTYPQHGRNLEILWGGIGEWWS
jgi:colicin import membrane protein